MSIEHVVNRASIEETVTRTISDALRLSRDRVTVTTSLVDDLKVDSLDALEIVLALEETFSIIIPNEVVPQFRTVADIIDGVCARLDEKVAG